MPDLTRKVFGRIASMAWPRPVNGSITPEPLRDEDLRNLDLEGLKIRGWRIDGKVVFPSPGHSPCSVSLLWPGKKALLVSDADWIGNPVFVFSSIRDCISSLNTFRNLTQAGMVELFLPAHGLVKRGRRRILSHLNFHISRLESVRDEVLSIYQDFGEKDVQKLTKLVVRHSPLMRTVHLCSTPRMVTNVFDTVALCLREADLLD